MVFLETGTIFTAGNCFILGNTTLYCLCSWRRNVRCSTTGNYIYHCPPTIIWRLCIRLAVYGMYCDFNWRNTVAFHWNIRTVFFKDVSGDKAQTDLYYVRNLH